MQSVQFNNNVEIQIEKRWGQFRFKTPEMEHAYKYFFFKNTITFAKLLSFVVLIACLPEICLLSFQMQGLGQTGQLVCPNENCSTEIVVQNYAGSPEVSKLAEVA